MKKYGLGGILSVILTMVFLNGVCLGQPKDRVQGEVQVLEVSMDKGYTIPTIDISGEEHRHVVVDRHPERYYGHPSTMLMTDGQTMYCAYSKDHGGPPLYLKKSLDGGLTWSGYLPVPENAYTLGNCPFLFHLPDTVGNERLVMMVGGDDDKADAMWQSFSYDGGESWTPYENNGLRSVVASPTMVAVEGGRKHLIWYHTYDPEDRMVRQKTGGKVVNRRALNVYQSASPDGGQTWGDTRLISAIEDASPCEPGVVLSPDGKTMACLMRENNRRLNSLVIFSDDGGSTWSRASELPASLTGDRHQPRYSHRKDYLVMTFRDMAEESPTKGDFVAWIGTFEDIVEGREGLCRVRLLDQPGGSSDCGYSGLELLPDGTFVATTYVRYRAGDAGNSIVSVRFTLQEIFSRLEGR